MKRLLALLTALVATTALLASAAGSASGTPVPEDDPFYAVPSNIASYANGAVINARRITAIAYVLPMPVDSWQILYKTNDAHGVPTATGARLGHLQIHG